MADTSAKSSLNENTETRLNLHLPSEGELRLSENRKFEETVIFVPFFEGNKVQLIRHSDFLNRLGYDTVIFNLRKLPRDAQGAFFSTDSSVGFKHIWADQVESILNAIAGPKIVYAFSNPAASAIEAIARRRAVDVHGLVCDCGPSADILTSFLTYFQYEYPIRFLPLRWSAALGMNLLWAPDYKSSLHKDLAALPKGFRILSIRGWKDKLIQAQDIDRVFDPQNHLDWQRLSLPQAGHLNGLRDYPEDYCHPVEQFLKSISTQI